MVEVFLGDRPVTVGGRLSKDAVLKVGEVTSRLDAFSIGVVVTVGWRLTAEGHEIMFLEAPIPPAMASTRAMVYQVPTKTVVGNPQYHIV